MTVLREKMNYKGIEGDLYDSCTSVHKNVEASINSIHIMYFYSSCRYVVCCINSKNNEHFFEYKYLFY